MKKILFFFLCFAPLCATPPNPSDPKYAWMDRLVEKNFKRYQKGISLQAIADTEHSDEHLLRFKVVNNVVHALSGKFGACHAMLEYLAQTYGLPDLDLLYYQEDGLAEPIHNGIAPIFCSSKKKWIDQGIYFVDWHSSMPHPKWDDIVERINNVCSLTCWRSRLNKLVWRGVPSDGFYSMQNWKTQFPRGKVCFLSLSHPDLIDARFVDICHNLCKNPKHMKKELPMADFMSIEDQLRYKYQIILDGIFTTYPGDRWRLLSGSVVFMPESDNGHWFYDALVPGVHYVSVKKDLSDLIEKLEYMRAHEDEAILLAANARTFALNFLLSEHIALYCYKALLKYASLLEKP